MPYSFTLVDLQQGIKYVELTMYMSSREFRDKYFSAESKPTEMTIRNWIRNKQIEGRKLGGKYYVLINEKENITHVEDEIFPDFSA